jgi:osmotically-inducible protein OsmY
MRDLRHDVRANLMRSRPNKKARHSEAERWLERSGWLLAGTVGAGAMYLFDPSQGRRRRSLARDRSAATVRRVGRRLGRMERRVAADAYGLSQKVAHLRPADMTPANDADLAQRAESVIFRHVAVPKGRININVEHGRLVLRGAVDRPEQIRDLEAAARKVPGVVDVKNLLHLAHTAPPSTPSAMDAD